MERARSNAHCHEVKRKWALTSRLPAACPRDDVESRLSHNLMPVVPMLSDPSI
jgi:hypothetical protein